MNSLRRDSYKEIVESAQIIERVFKENKISIKPTTYIATCLRFAYELYDAWQRQDYSITRDGTFLKILLDALECRRIGQALKWARERPGLDRKIRLLLKGCLWPYYKSKKNPAKDIAFEIYTLADFEKAGFNAKFEEPDIIFQYNGREFSVACKFAHSAKNLHKLIRKAVKQVEQSNKSGLIALCIDEISPHNLFQDSFGHFTTYLNGIFSRFIVAHDMMLNKAIKSDKIIGLVMSYSTSFIARNENLPIVAHEYGINPRCDEKTIDFTNLSQIVTKLQSVQI